MGGDEINIIKPGRNYGWPVVSYGIAYSGDPTGDTSGPLTTNRTAPGMEDPFLYWVPSIAVSGMVFYTGDQFSSWKGNIFVGARRGTQLQRIVLNAKGQPVARETLLSELKQRIADVRQGPDGFLYLVTDESAAALLKIEPIKGDSTSTGGGRGAGVRERCISASRLCSGLCRDFEDPKLGAVIGRVLNFRHQLVVAV